MKNKFKILMPVMAIALLFTLAACNNDEDGAYPDGFEIELGELTIGLMPSVDAFPIVIAYYHGYFEDEGLTVHLEPFVGSGYRDAALQAGLLDGATVDLVAVGLSRGGAVPLQATGLTSGRFTLVASDGFDSIESLAGETVVISQNTAIDFVLDQMIDLAGVDADDIETLAIPAIPARLEYLRAGNVAAALLPEPWASVALAEGFVEITNTVEIGFIPFVIAFTDDVVENQAADIQAFYRAYDRAIDFLRDAEMADYFPIMVEVIGFPAEVAEHLIMPEFFHSRMPEDHVVEAAIAWLLSRNLISTNDEMSADDLISTVAFD
ncbi:MAG: ABC transporter substrate-binding protein [Turicibacter sp.]|nr:ABC transporter substrate-binding protein [Turicibacter sp.]